MRALSRKLLCIATIVAVIVMPTGCVSASYRMYKITKRQVKKEQSRAAARRAMRAEDQGQYQQQQEQQAPPRE